jgi:hypothetical protein
MGSAKASRGARCISVAELSVAYLACKVIEEVCGLACGQCSDYPSDAVAFAEKVDLSSSLEACFM